MASAGKAEGKTKTEIVPVIDDTVEAKVVERKGSKGENLGSTVTYTAPVKEIEVENEDDIEDEGDLDLSAFEADEPEVGQNYTIPQTPLDAMFHNISYCVQNGEQDLFFASVFRVADPIGSRYRIPCIGGMELGMFQFTTRDRFGFLGELHRLNNKSGGHFNVAIFRHDSTPLYILIPPHGRYNTAAPTESNRQIGIVNYGIPDQQIDDTTTGAPNDSNAALMAYMDKAEQRFETLMREVVGRPKEPSVLEKALEAKMIKDLTDPTPPPTNGIEQIMMNMFAMPVMVEKMSKRMFPEPPTPSEPNGFDRAAQILDLPPVAGLLNSVGNISEAWAISKLQQQAGSAPTQQNPTQQPTEQETEMQELMSDLIDELESDTPFNADNEFLKELQTDYPTQAAMITGLCKGMAFEGVLNMLIGSTGNLNPNPFHQFWDIPATNQTQSIVWNERGQKLLIRLQEFYEYVKTV